MARRVNVSDLLGTPPPDSENAEGAERPEKADRLIHVKASRLLPNPHNPRDEVGDLSDLSSIQEIQRQSLLIVTRAAYLGLYPEEAEELRGYDYVVVNGCRRHAAAVKYGREQLACAVNDSVARSRAALRRAAYDENVERRDLDPIEEAKAVVAIVSEYPTAKEAAEAEGWTGAWISQRKSLLKLHPDVQSLVRSHARTGGETGLSIRAARRLGSVKGIEGMSAQLQLLQLERLAAEDAAKKAADRQTRLGSKKAEPTPVPGSPRSTAVDPARDGLGPGGSESASGENEMAPSAAHPKGEAPKFTAVNPEADVASLPEPRSEEASRESGEDLYLVPVPALVWNDPAAVYALLRERMSADQRTALASLLIDDLEAVQDAVA
ncbi:ParB/RepB/Spo0J family partition protein [Kitasatospora sp. NPDC058063]|uniref:ParB/RepB/Spo0J family partition protein n=1 Tax=unclassified Kitasatospora TaxID=2633591 RepID=UPI0036DC3994